MAGPIVTRAFSGTTDTIVAGDNGNMLRFTGVADCVLSVTAAATLGASFACGIENVGTVNAKLTIDPNSTEKVDGANTLDMFPGDVKLLICDNTGGAEFRTEPSSTPRNLAFMGVSLPSGIFKRIFGSNLALGDNDIYTVPTGKRALIGQPVAYNASAGTIAWFTEIKVSGTYYRLGPTTSSTTLLGSATSNNAGIILEAGEIIAVNLATTAGLNVQFPVIEFDASASLKSVKVLGPATGDNTLYTCPAGKSAVVLSQVGAIPLDAIVGTGLSGSIYFCCDAGGTRNVKIFSVASGGASATTNQLSGATGFGASTRGTLGFNGALGAGDFLVVNVDVGNAAQITWANILEF